MNEEIVLTAFYNIVSTSSFIGEPNHTVSNSSPQPIGYQNKDIPKLLSNQICTFEKVGSEGSDITEFVPVDENGSKLSGECNLQFFNDRGKLTETYCWFYGEDIDTGMEDGWYDDNQDETKNRPLDFGEGFKVVTSYEGSKLVYSGEIDVGAVAVPIPKLLSCKGNIRPCEIKMSDLIPVDENDDPVSGEINLQFFNDRGKLIETYCWFFGEDIDTGMKDGWYDDNQDETKDRSIDAGEGFCIVTSYEGAYLKFSAIGSKK